jgi:hypothetical protein
MGAEQHLCRLGVGLEYSDISLKGAQGGPRDGWSATKKSTTPSRLGEMPEEEVARHFVDESGGLHVNRYPLFI